MKKISFILTFLILSIGVFAQSTPVSELRVANATTTFGNNIPVGTKVYNVADGTYFVATAGVLGTATLTSASGSFDQLNPDDLQTIGVTTNTISLSQSGGDVTIAGGGINTVTTSGTTITVTGTEVDGDVTNELQDLSYDAATNALGISLDGTGVSLPTAVSGGNDGLLSGADKAKLDNLDTGATNTTFKVESFSEAANGTTGQDNTLTNTPKASSSVLVSLNGGELKASQYTVSTNKVTVSIPVYQYDMVTVSYTY